MLIAVPKLEEKVIRKNDCQRVGEVIETNILGRPADVVRVLWEAIPTTGGICGMYHKAKRTYISATALAPATAANLEVSAENMRRYQKHYGNWERNGYRGAFNNRKRPEGLKPLGYPDDFKA
jgi:hypothetical protein